jgi:hypothetical protein
MEDLFKEDLYVAIEHIHLLEVLLQSHDRDFRGRLSDTYLECIIRERCDGRYVSDQKHICSVCPADRR